MEKLSKTYMRLIVLTSLVLFIGKAFSQTATDPARGMYVDNFFTLEDPNNPSPTASTVADLTILGDITKETELFTFCQENHITRIVLYDLRTIFLSSRESDLCSFIALARSNGITKIGGAIASSSMISNTAHLRQVTPTPAYSFTSSEISYFTNTSNIDKKWLYDLVIANHSVSDPDLERAEYLKDLLNIARLSIMSSCSNSEHFDFLTLEYEFWNSGYSYSKAQSLIEDMYAAKAIVQTMHSGVNLETELYLGDLRKDGGVTQNPTIINSNADWLDGKTIKDVIGTGTIQNSATNTVNMPPYGNYFTGKRDQMLILASELSGQGLKGGYALSSLAFDVVSSANSLGYKGFTIRIGHTTATSLTSTFLTSTTTQVFNSDIPNPSIGWNEHVFTTPFTWDGTSNILVETYFTNCVSCSGTTCLGYASGTTYTQNAVTNQTSTSFVSHSWFYSNSNGCSPETQTIATSTASVRPNMRFKSTLPSFLLDRMLFTTYDNDPAGTLLASYHDDVYNAFEHPGNTRATPFHPLFSSCSQALGFGDNGFADWFRKSESNNIFTAEQNYYDQVYNYTSVSGVTDENTLQPGSARWYVYSQMIHDNFNPGSINVRSINTFSTNSPVICSGTNTTASVVFNYTGPIEDNIEITEFKILNTGSLTLFQDLIGTLSSVYTPIYTPTGGVINLGSHNLPIGDYKAVLKLEYGNTYSKSCTLDVKVISNSTTPDLVAVGSSSFCDNGSLTLKAPYIAGVDSYKWYKAGTTSPVIKNTLTNPYWTPTASEFSALGAGPTFLVYCKITYNTSSTITTNNFQVTRNPNGVPLITEYDLSGLYNTGDRKLSATGNPSTGCTYSWSTGSISNPLNTGSTGYLNYQLFARQPSGCVNTAKFNVVRATCGTSNFTYQFAGSPSGGNLSNYVTTLIGLTSSNSLLIAGDFHFDRDFIIDCDVVVLEGAKIYVDNGHTLTLNTNSHLYACDKMWKGIEVANGATLVMTGNATIADAEYGITALEGSILNINGGASGTCVFDKCYQSILLPAYVTQRNYTINNTKFISSGALALSYSGQTTTPGAKTNTGINALGRATLILNNIEFNGLQNGIKIDNGVINVTGSSISVVSKFLNLDYAIIASNNSTITSTFCNWSNIKDLSLPAGVASVAINNTGTGVTQLIWNNFTNCDLAIREANGTAYFKENNFNSINTAIEVISPSNKSVFIQSNTINCKYSGLNLLIMENAATLNVRYNNIEVGNQTNPTAINSYGINYTATVSNSSNYRHLIRNNQITLTSQGMGINASNKGNIGISDNTIQLQKVGTMAIDQVGINCSSNNYSVVTCNYVNGDNNSIGSLQNNMRFSQCVNSNVMCNTVLNGGDGMRFTGGNGLINLRHNSFDNDYRGLYLDNMSTSIGPQNHKGNTWSGSYTTTNNHYSAQNLNFSFGQEISIDLANSSSIYLPSAVNPTNWIKNDPNSGKEEGCVIEAIRGQLTYQSPICGFNSSPFNASREREQITYSDTLIVSDSLPASLFGEEIDYEARRELFNRLSENSAARDSILLFSAFYDSLNNSNIGAFNEIDHIEQNGDSATKMILDNMLAIDSIISWHWSIIAYNDSTGDSTLISQNNSHYSAIENLTQSKYIYEQILEQGRYTQVQLARQLNNDIEVNTIMDENRAIVNDIRLDCIEQGNYDYDKSVDIILSGIAHQCPQAGGNAVIIARALYGIRHPNEYYDDKNACLAQGFFRITQKNNESKKVSSPLSYFAINPNPASDYLTLDYFLSDNSKVEFNLFNSLQQKTKSIILPSEIKEIGLNCSELSSGIYFYSVRVGDQLVYQGKLSIINSH